MHGDMLILMLPIAVPRSMCRHLPWVLSVFGLMRSFAEIFSNRSSKKFSQSTTIPDKSSRVISGCFLYFFLRIRHG
jgi:hypothetical protein